MIKILYIRNGGLSMKIKSFNHDTNFIIDDIEKTQENEIGIYVHIPFCIRKCSYCDFISFPTSKELINSYLDSLEIEISLYKKKIDHYTIKTIFIGGGTPTSLDNNSFDRLLKIIDRGLSLSQNKASVEYTVEANPKTITKEIAKSMVYYGVNRVSLGLQSSNEKELQLLGRVHTFDDLSDSISILRANSIYNINVDLIYGLPNQSIETFQKSLKDLMALSVDHISCYSLILEEGTRLYDMEKSGAISMPSEEDDLLMYETAILFLEKNGYIQYEISNFAKQNKKCLHNIIYWKNKDYLGLGVSAHGFIDKERYENADNIEDYASLLNENKYPIVKKEKIKKEMLFEEWIFLRLRMNEGISFDEINSEFDIDFKDKYSNILDKLRKDGLVEFNEESFFLTTKGFELSNYVFLEILSLD